MEKLILPAFTILMGLALWGLWIKDIIAGRFKGNFFVWKDGDNVMWPRIVAELLTGTFLLVSGIAFIFHKGWAELLTLFALGSIFYSSLTGLEWTAAKKQRWPATVVMVIGLVGSVIFISVVMIQLT